ncbi:MAG: M67 family metallopeptidase [Actinobacteria bacterium]|nr:M67 family metallopeptidase [Actinomycetota bacterium]
MLKIYQKIVDEIYRHALKEAPLEACGYLAGKKNIITKNYPMTNIDESRVHFTFDVNEQFRVIRDVRSNGLEVIAVYHSHPNSPARLSEEDIRLANDPDIYYIVVSAVRSNLDIRSFKIKDGVIKVEKLKVISNME